MGATKTNERPGTRAVARHIRVSASKTRAVLDLIRGESYGRATEILEFSERSVSEVVSKCLDSAVANAEHNDEISAEELYVSACFADEGPTLKRWRPRARGRATRINKRTCHITIIVSRYSVDELEAMRERAESRGRVDSSEQAAESRRQRVQKSRAVEAEAEAAEEAEAAADGRDTEEALGEAAEILPEEVTGEAIDEAERASDEVTDEVAKDAVDEAEEDVVDEDESAKSTEEQG
ncbi:MAG TPA: 50S ribosomal protein L22 [Acidimicrobiaceae bacterium]|jgi:large subunit ribosomal protein L22|nr:50S ribosomal protein L22 [Acidimicrobiaceae bacterium]HCV35425.1 50S ribosomal protein L22 [Acidimicrobiaceae bacterium]|tara:strand:+ start:2717 stop:3427 length:711 start_codon:yes stop_codon:yes gene_type:complete